PLVVDVVEVPKPGAEGGPPLPAGAAATAAQQVPAGGKEPGGEARAAADEEAVIAVPAPVESAAVADAEELQRGTEQATTPALEAPPPLEEAVEEKALAEEEVTQHEEEAEAPVPTAPAPAGEATGESEPPPPPAAAALPAGPSPADVGEGTPATEAPVPPPAPSPPLEAGEGAGEGAAEPLASVEVVDGPPVAAIEQEMARAAESARQEPQAVDRAEAPPPPSASFEAPVTWVPAPPVPPPPFAEETGEKGGTGAEPAEEREETAVAAFEAPRPEAGAGAFAPPLGPPTRSGGPAQEETRPAQESLVPSAAPPSAPHAAAADGDDARAPYPRADEGESMGDGAAAAPAEPEAPVPAARLPEAAVASPESAPAPDGESEAPPVPLLTLPPEETEAPSLFPEARRLAALAKEYEKQAPRNEKGKRLQFNTSELRYRVYLQDLKIKVESKWEYPLIAVKNGWQGWLRIDFDIRRDGSLGEVKIVKSSKYPPLDEAAVTALKLAAPFSPFPHDFELDEITIRARFEYIIYR
ncbi:MAG TPA: TonB family protein, partial [Deltaproteobacteria bacterium]|nr:TonB family protein [Deltaproteobacteria bacterium]